MKKISMAAAAFVAVLSAPVVAHAQSQPRTEIVIDAGAEGPTINKNVYGQFMEHLGRGIYEGVWVGEDSPIPNTRGYRNDVLEAVRALKVPLIRWPGGCFADIYHWRDGVGPRAQRPVRLNSLWGGVEENNQFGTHEFFNFAELVGAEAYLNFNIGTGTPSEMMDWIEYITSDSNSALANERRRNGRSAPWKLPYITIGNETWGCGGNMRPEFYVDLYAQWATFAKLPASVEFIASGATGDDLKWTEALMAHPTAPKLFDAVSLHQYTLPTGSWTGSKGPATGFGEDQWMSTLRRARSIGAIVAAHDAVMDKYDPEQRVGLYVDEWGAWYDTEPGANDAFLYQQNTLRDALVAAVSLNEFHAHADRVRMANIAQMVNVLQAMILTDGPRMLLTPTYHVFAMYQPFHDAQALPLDLRAPDYTLGAEKIPAVSASAAKIKDGAIVIALANLDPRRPAPVEARLAGVRGAVSGRVLTADAMDAHNTFDRPDALRPQPFRHAGFRDGLLTVTLPPKSVVVLTID